MLNTDAYEREATRESFTQEALPFLIQKVYPSRYLSFRAVVPLGGTIEKQLLAGYPFVYLLMDKC